MIKKIIKDGFLYTLPSILSRGMSLFLIPLYTRVLSPSDYGYFDLLMTFSALAHLFVSFEISQAMPHYFSSSNSVDEKKRYGITAFVFTVFCYLLFVGASLVFDSTVSHLLFREREIRTDYYYGIAMIGIGGVWNFYHNQLRWELKSKELTGINIVSSLVAVITSLVLTIYYNIGLKGLVIANLMSNLLSVIIAIRILRFPRYLILDIKALTEMLKYTLPFVPSGLSVFLGLYIDRIMINEFLSLNEVGIYGIAVRIASVASLLVIGFEMSITPMIFSNLKKEETREEVSNLFRYFFFFASLLTLGISLYADSILHIFTTQDYFPSLKAVPYLVGSLLVSKFYLFTPGVFVGKKSVEVFVINLCSACLNIILNLFFIPRFGFHGAALATFVSQSLGFALYFKFGQKHYKVHFPWGKIACLLLLSFTIIYFIYSSDGSSGSIDRFFMKTSLLFGYCVFAVGISLIKVTEIKSLIEMLFFKMKMRLQK